MGQLQESTLDWCPSRESRVASPKFDPVPSWASLANLITGRRSSLAIGLRSPILGTSRLCVYQFRLQLGFRFRFHSVNQRSSLESAAAVVVVGWRAVFASPPQRQPLISPFTRPVEWARKRSTCCLGPQPKMLPAAGSARIPLESRRVPTTTTRSLLGWRHSRQSQLGRRLFGFGLSSRLGFGLEFGFEFGFGFGFGLVWV